MKVYDGIRGTIPDGMRDGGRIGEGGGESHYVLYCTYIKTY